jgi:hypothetical protein
LKASFLRIAFAGILALTYGAIWTINSKPLPVREHFYQRYFSFPASTPQSYEDWRYYFVWLDCVRAGAPTDRPCSLGSGIPWAYPSAWLLLARTGLSARHTVPTAALLYIGLIAISTWLLTPGSILELAFYALFFVSPPFILALERCNMDVLVFILLGAAVILGNRRTIWAAFSLVWVAALLKIYPAASLPAFVRKRNDFFVAGFLGTTLLAYIVAIRQQLKLLSVVVAQTEYESFGSPEAFLIMAKKLEALGHPVPMLHGGFPLIAVVIFSAGLIILAATLIRRGLAAEIEIISNTISARAFGAGALVYCFCWAVGMNFNYRYMFVALTLPQAWSWASGNSRWRGLFRAYLLAALAEAWLALFQFSHPWIEGFHAILGWFLYGTLFLVLIPFAGRILLTLRGDGFPYFENERAAETP